MSIPNFIGISAKAYGQRPPARGLCTRALLSETPSPLRFGIAHPGRPKLHRYIHVPVALPPKA
ncbi:hypothetical protein EYY94_03870 [Obesumbacterium proteus]|nr:hypothetical protein EYY94_03870 [Obesumbacterium proteus]